MPNCKNPNWLHAKTIVTQSWYDSIEIFSILCFALFLVMAEDSHLGMQYCKKIKMASYKQRSSSKLDQFQPRILEILSFSCLCYF